MPEVISNTTPFQYLHQIGCLDCLSFAGTLGALMKAKQAGLIAAIGPYLDQLDKAGFYLSANVRAKVLTLAGEAP